MDNKAKEAVLIVILAVGLFLVFKPKESKLIELSESKVKYKKPSFSDEDMSNPLIEDAYIGLCAYIDAYNDGATQKLLDEVNAEIGKKFEMQVVKISENILSVEDLKGKEILTTKV